MRRVALIFSICCCLWPGAAFAQTYDMDVRLTPADASMNVTARVLFQDPKPADSFEFFLHGEFRVEKLIVNEAERKVDQKVIHHPGSYSLTALRVKAAGLSEAVRSIEVSYGGMLNRSASRWLSDYYRIDPTGAYLRGDINSFWFPVFAEPGSRAKPITINRVRVETPLEHMAVVNGERLEEGTAGKRRYSVWRPGLIDPVAVQLTARPYRRFEGKGAQIYALQDDTSLERARAIVRFTEQIDALYRAYFAKDPGKTSTIHVMELPKFGDISSANVIGLSEEAWRAFDPLEYSGRTLAHELVHDFVVTPAAQNDPIAALAREGFPSYFYLPPWRELAGAKRYDAYMKSIEKYYLSVKEAVAKGEDKKNPPDKPLAELTLADISQYKDTYVLSLRTRLFFDYMRVKMGDDAFKAATREIVSTDKLTYDAFRQAFISRAPKLAEDMRVWLETTEYPDRFRRQ